MTWPTCSEEAEISDLRQMLAWMPAMEKKAKGHTEAAQAAFRDLQEAVGGGKLQMWDRTLEFAWSQASSAYAELSDWDGLEAFVAGLEVRERASLEGSRGLQPVHVRRRLVAERHLKRRF